MKYQKTQGIQVDPHDFFVQSTPRNTFEKTNAIIPSDNMHSQCNKLIEDLKEQLKE
jgi:hypothetical protein